MNWRDHLRQGRRDVHDQMRVPAVYAKSDGSAPVRVNVRVHTRFASVQPQGMGQGMPALVDTTPRLVFDRTEIMNPLRTYVVAVGPTEIYTLGLSRPPNAEHIIVHVSELPEAEAIARWKPEWAELLQP